MCTYQQAAVADPHGPAELGNLLQLISIAVGPPHGRKVERDRIVDPCVGPLATHTFEEMVLISAFVLVFLPEHHDQ